MSSSYDNGFYSFENQFFFCCVILSFTQFPVPNVSNKDIELGSTDDAIDNEHQEVQLEHEV